MKTIAMMMIALLAISLVAPMVLAETDTVVGEIEEEVVIEDAGITPDSPLYGLDKAMERIRLAFARGEVNKAKLKLKFAEERLSETEQMVDEGNDEAAAEAEEAYNEELEETQELVEEIESDGEEDVAESALDDVSEIQLGLLSHSEKVAFVKNRILERMMVGNVSDEKIAHLEEVFGRIQTKAQEVEAKMEEKRTRVRRAYKVLSGKNESELTEREALFLENANKAKENREEIQAQIKANINERIKSRQELRNNSEEDIEEDESEDEEDNASSIANRLGRN